MSHAPAPFYLNGNSMMHGTRSIADGTTGQPMTDVEVLRRVNAHDELVAALRLIANSVDSQFVGTYQREVARAALAKVAP